MDVESCPINTEPVIWRRTRKKQADPVFVPVNCLRYRLVKRAVDLLLVVLAMPLVLPLLLFLAILIKLTSPGPVFYRHVRVGQHGHPFCLWKLRTMLVESEVILSRYFEENPEAKKQWLRQYKLQKDPRVTSLGRFLRKTSLDELPQLLNVLRGEMSLVGPRPVIDAEILRYGGGVELCLAAKPGLTGLWQVRGRGNVRYELRVSYDLEYVSTWSLGRDLLLIIRTIPAIWSAEGAF